MLAFNWRGLISAFQTITAIPLACKGCAKAEDSLVWFPWVGLTLGGAAWAIAWLGMRAAVLSEVRQYWLFVLAVLIVSAWALLTRGFHLDGLADMCDGFGGGWTAERVLEIMRDSRIGAFGVIGLVLCIVLKVMAVAMLLGSEHWEALLAVPVLSRLAMVFQAVYNRYARRQAAKISMANHFIDMARPAHFFGAGAYALIALGIAAPLVALRLWPMLSAILVVGITVLVIGYMSRRKIDGVTGDILGATCELCETFGLIAYGLAAAL